MVIRLYPKTERRIMLVWAAVRDVDGEEIPSKQSVRGLEKDVIEYCDWVKKHTPEWDKKYPVVRITRFRCVEV